MRRKSMAALIVVGILLVAAIAATATTAPSPNDDVSPQLKASCLGHGAVELCAGHSGEGCVYPDGECPCEGDCEKPAQSRCERKCHFD
jgi:hypothetical protein